ncbi:Cysteine-rich RLK (RECEPTOR-like protein kinase) 8 [Cucumis melo var. makuwa]|uniref:Cysteine-rich RLK (RECEPTOR-like protein kinase) 8 n=1 Tax=Cucumis melo var. makuwa TaxID=1194695 RepID=A0A5A7U5Z0_CUCMM|nr:Cysteine-rich RLK (RECEPTOR-like protein kinase) 8 [Cucumis melo var. makuwa]
MFLEGRHKFSFLTGRTVRPLPGDALERLWKEEDSLTRSMLINNMEPQIDKPLLYAATAKDLWDTTQTFYSKRQNASRCIHCENRQFGTHQMTVLNMLNLKRPYEPPSDMKMLHAPLLSSVTIVTSQHDCAALV